MILPLIQSLHNHAFAEGSTACRLGAPHTDTAKAKTANEEQ